MAHVSGPTRWAFARHDVVARGKQWIDGVSEAPTARETRPPQVNSESVIRKEIARVDRLVG